MMMARNPKRKWSKTLTYDFGISRTFGESQCALPNHKFKVLFQTGNGSTLRFKRSKLALP